MNPLPPSMEFFIPDWRFQLMAAVVIAWVVAMYGFLLWVERRATRRTERLRCPDTGRMADVLVRVGWDGRAVDVLGCSLLRHGATCPKTCIAMAAP